MPTNGYVMLVCWHLVDSVAPAKITICTRQNYHMHPPKLPYDSIGNFGGCPSYLPPVFIKNAFGAPFSEISEKLAIYRAFFQYWSVSRINTTARAL